MKRFLIQTAALGVWAAFLGGAAAGANIPVDGYAAAVDDAVITVSEVTDVMQPVVRQLRDLYSGEELDRKMEEAYETALNSLIERKLILADFGRLGASLPDNVVDARVEEILRTKFNNNRAELLRALDADGLTLEEWRRQIRERIVVGLMREREVDSRIHLSPKDAREAYEKNRDKYRVPEQVELRMIVINRGKTEEELAVKRKQVEEVRKRLLAGENFEDLAKTISEGPKAADGGYHGWVEPSSRRKEIAEALRSVKPGEIGEVIETEEDFYIVKVEARKAESLTPFEKVQEDISLDLRKEQAQRLYEEWVERLKQKAYICRF